MYTDMPIVDRGATATSGIRAQNEIRFEFQDAPEAQMAKIFGSLTQNVGCSLFGPRSLGLFGVFNIRNLNFEHIQYQRAFPLPV